MADISKVCINCGLPVKDKCGRRLSQMYDETLYKKCKILKLVECGGCGEVADRYIEYEGTIILLDLALQNTAAYRHVLLNNNHWLTISKMAVLTLIVEGYCRWAWLNTGGEFFEQEYEFYIKCGEAAASLLVYLCTSLLVHSLSHSRGSLPCLVLGLLLAYCTRFLQLIALLWATTDFLWLFIEGLFYLTSSRVFQVMTGRGRASSLVTMGVAHLAAHVNDKSAVVLGSVHDLYMG